MSNTDSYTPPKVWQWDAENGGEWAKTNCASSAVKFSGSN